MTALIIIVSMIAYLMLGSVLVGIGISQKEIIKQIENHELDPMDYIYLFTIVLLWPIIIIMAVVNACVCRAAIAARRCEEEKETNK